MSEASLSERGLEASGTPENTPRSESDESCECPPGYRHERGCPIAYWPEEENT